MVNRATIIFLTHFAIFLSRPQFHWPPLQGPSIIVPFPLITPLHNDPAIRSPMKPKISRSGLYS
jgi:hypothetical protein